MMPKQLDIYTDGACSGNPGSAGIGIVIKDEGRDIWQFSKSIGIATNNIAEYAAVIYALQKALILRAENVTIHTDSELFYRQLHGEYRVRNPHIKFLFDLVQHMRTGFRDFRVEHHPRERNKVADQLAKRALKTEQAKVVASEFISGEESPSSKG